MGTESEDSTTARLMGAAWTAAKAAAAVTREVNIMMEDETKTGESIQRRE